MKIILGLLTALWVGGVIAEITINKPLLTLVNSKGVVVATDSTSISKAMEKASFLVDGVYTLRRPDVTITVKHAFVEPNIAPVAVTGGDQVVNEGTRVFFPGCNLSYDTDGTIVKCEITQVIKPGDPVIKLEYTVDGLAYIDVPRKSSLVAGGG